MSGLAMGMMLDSVVARADVAGGACRERERRDPGRGCGRGERVATRERAHSIVPMPGTPCLPDAPSRNA